MTPCWHYENFKLAPELVNVEIAPLGFIITSMEINFFNNDQVPKPKGEVRIESLRATPYPDRRRVFVEIEVTPFQERPNLILVARDESDEVVGELNIIETMHAKMEFTLHIRTPGDPAGAYSITCELFYENKNPPQDERIIGFVIPQEYDENAEN